MTFLLIDAHAVDGMQDPVTADHFPEYLERRRPSGAPDFIADLARLELAVYRAKRGNLPGPVSEGPVVNPSLQILTVSWKNLYRLLDRGAGNHPIFPGAETLLAWQMPRSGSMMIRPAMNNDLLAIKMAVEKLSAVSIAATENITLAALRGVFQQAVKDGLLIMPASRICRDLSLFNDMNAVKPEYASAEFFTLQWHITQTCDLQCAHCYDRSDRQQLSLETALCILDQLSEFCNKRHVTGQVSFTGGNPLLYPHFLQLYREAVDRDFYTAVLGNPSPESVIEDILAIQAPVYFQVSLEGLESHNDLIRGAGHFRRTLDFLGVLKRLGIPSTVMLTLTRANMAQVLPLAEILSGLADEFTFNRLSQMGEGADLLMADPEEYAVFLEEYHREAEHNNLLGLKESLFNIIRLREGKTLLGGCAGHGCGAAFNFMALLSDGEVHACRKFPSLIGTVNTDTLSGIYDSEKAALYRAGPASCRACPLSLVCRGCLAAVYSTGGDIHKDRDPWCFFRTTS